MLVLRNTVGFRAAVNAMRSLDGSKDVSYHTFSQPDYRYLLLLVKNLGRQMPEDVVW